MKKRLISILLTMLMVMSLFSGMSVSAYADDNMEDLYVEYTLAEGDYVLRICQKLGINYYTCKEAIMAINNITSENGFRYLSVGEVVKIPVSDAAAIAIMSGNKNTGSTGTSTDGSGSVSSGATVAYYLIPYTMQRGETVLGVCNSLGISFANYADQIMKINGISSWNNVHAGTTLLLPSNKTPAVGTTCYAVVAHKVASGDTAYTLCQNYGVSYGGSTKLLQALNNTENLGNIKVGRNFYMPVATTIKAASTSTSTNTNTNTNTNNNNTNTNTGANTTNNAKSYDITANINTTYGSIAFYVNNSGVNSAKEGDVVTVNVTTKDGRAVESLIVKFDDGRADVKLDANSFIMPACDVRVDANIKTGNDITINSNYSFKTAAQVGGINVSSASAGSSVKITSTDPGFEVKEIEAYYSTMFGLKKQVISVNEQNCFVMPDKDVIINVTLAPVTTYNFYRADPDHGSFDIQVDGNSVSKAAKGAKVTVVWQAMSGWDISEINVYKADKYGKYNTADSINVFNNSFTMPASPVFIDVKFECTQNLISIDAVEGGMLYVTAKNGTESISEAKTGEAVVVRGKAHVNADGYSNEIKELVVIRKADGHSVALTDNGDGTFGFDMPAGGVIVSGKLESVTTNTVSVFFNGTGSENRVTLKADGYENFSVIDNNSGASNAYAVGTQIKLSTLARDSHAFTKYMVYFGAGKVFNQEATDAANDQGLLIMPNENVIIEAYFSADTIDIEPATVVGKGSISYRVGGKSVNSCKVGDIVEIVAVAAHSEYEVTEDCITVINNATDKILNVTKNAAGNFEFQMPAGGVTISVKFNEGGQRTATLYVRPFDNDNDTSLQGKNLVEARIYDGYNPIVDNDVNGTKIDTKGGEAIVVYLTDAAVGYEIDRIKVESTNGGVAYEGGLEYVSENKYRVWVVDSDLDITVYLKHKNSQEISLNNISWNVNKGSVGSTIGSYTNPVVSSAKVGDIVCIVPQALEPYYVTADSLYISRNSDGGAMTMGAENTDNANITEGKYYPVKVDGEIVAWKYKMPAGGVTAHVEFKAGMHKANLDVFLDTDTAKANNLNGEGYIILSATDTNNLYEVSNGQTEDIAYGSKVSVRISASGDKLYRIKSVAAKGVSVDSRNSFVMPENEVDIEVILEELNPAPTTVKLSTAADRNGSVQYYLDAACTQLITDGKAAVNSYVYVKLQPNEGYVVQDGYPTAKNDFDNTSVTLGNEGNGVYSFQTGENDITVSASFVKENYVMTIYVGGSTENDVNVTVEKTGITSAVKNGDTITVPYNTKVTFAVKDTDAFTLKSATASEGTMKNVSKTGANITMPAADIYVDLVLEVKS